jgi:hypothetical protein
MEVTDGYLLGLSVLFFSNKYYLTVLFEGECILYISVQDVWRKSIAEGV